MELKDGLIKIDARNLRVFRHSVLGATQAEMAQLTGLSVPTIQAIERVDSYRMRATRVTQVIERLGVPPSEFHAIFSMDSTAGNFSAPQLQERQWVRKLSVRLVALRRDVEFTAGLGNVESVVTLRRVPFFDFRMSASGWSEGFEGRKVEDADGFIDVPSDAPQDAFAFRIQGQCMEPKFPDGAIVVCVPIRPGDHGQQFIPGKAYYCQRAGEQATFKLCFYEPPKNRYRLEPLNKKYKSLYVPEQDMQRMSRAIKIVIDL